MLIIIESILWHFVSEDFHQYIFTEFCSDIYVTSEPQYMYVYALLLSTREFTYTEWNKIYIQMLCNMLQGT
jgi:hypothetical protein